NPGGVTDSVALAIGGGKQVGWALVGGVRHASLWRGTADSWFDLSVLLPAGFSSSEARGIFRDDANLSIVGYGHNTLTGRDEALLWSRPVPASSTVVLLGLGGL